MQEVTELVRQWIACCQDVWSRWFRERADGEHEFIDIENALLEVFVVQPLSKETRRAINTPELWKYVKAKYRIPVSSERPVCRVQASGNTYCEPRHMVAHVDEYFCVKSVDTIGRVTGEGPYIELFLADGMFVLEETENVTLFVDEDCVVAPSK